LLADHQLNRECWDLLAAVHGQDAYYDTASLCGGANSLIPEEEAALSAAVGADLEGKRVLQLQCHLGFDAITFARRGASVSGVDFSNVALEKARALAARCGVSIDWVCADVVELPESFACSFDLVWATIGILCWIADLSAWMRSAAGALAPGGKLVLIDGIPRTSLFRRLARLIRPGKLTDRQWIERGWDYATPLRTGPQVQFRHSVRSVVAAAERAGLRIRSLEEHGSISSELCLGLLRGRDGRYRRPHGDPVLFTLIAEREALTDTPTTTPAGRC
jgi:SAM-dependent methyltransferase